MTRENMIRLINIRKVILEEFYVLCKDDLKFSNFKEDLKEGYFEGFVEFEESIKIKLNYGYKKYKFCVINIEHIDFDKICSVLKLKEFFNTLYNVCYTLDTNIK